MPKIHIFHYLRTNTGGECTFFCGKYSVNQRFLQREDNKPEQANPAINVYIVHITKKPLIVSGFKIIS
jgi:hypothetical protein